MTDSGIPGTLTKKRTTPGFDSRRETTVGPPFYLLPPSWFSVLWSTGRTVRPQDLDSGETLLLYGVSGRRGRDVGRTPLRQEERYG